MTGFGPGRSTTLLLKAGGTARMAPWIIAPMAYLATMSLAVALALTAIAGDWHEGASGGLTVELPPAVHSADSERQAAAAIALVQAWPTVVRAEILSRQEVIDLIEPLLGTGLPARDLPLPTLIAVESDQAVPVNHEALQTALREVVPDAFLVDHAAWLSDLTQAAAAARAVLVGVVSLTALAAAATVVAVTSAGMSIHRRIIELLHIMGATDGHVAGLFQRQALVAGAIGGGAGFTLALATLFALGRIADSVEAPLLPAASIGPWWWPLFLVPVAAALLAMLTARVTVLVTLARMP